jgi:L-alanine-DL-glutamate epimerase-like enolase superfamily enzyme
MAALNAWTLASGTSLATLWGGASDCVESDITIPIAPDAGVLAALAWSAGLRIFKIKVGGGTLQEDYDRIAAVREAAPNARIRIDANQAFSVADAIAFANRLLEEGTHLDFVEQPVRKDDFEGMAAVAAACPVPVFADESVRTPADALRLTQTPVGGFNCKINKNGIAGVLDIIAIAKASGRQLMLGCMLETRRSIAVSLALACGTGAFDYIDLDSHLLLNEAGANAHFEQEGAQLTLRAPKGD